MAAQDSRVGDRQTASMRIKLKYPDVETFIQKYAMNISRGGIFIATKQPKPVGTFVRFEFLISDATQSSIIRGEGQVQWTKEYDANSPGKAHGMGVKFTRLDAESQAVIDRALKWRAEHGTSAIPLTVPTSSAHTVSTATTPPPPTPPPPALETTAVERPVRQTPPPPPPLVLAREEPATTRPLALTLGLAGRGETRPITIDQGDEDTNVGRPSHIETRPIQLGETGPRPRDEIDELANEWGLSEEKLERILKRARPRMAEATAELEDLLLKPAKLPAPTKAEALEQIGPLLDKKNARNGTPTQ